MWAKLNTKKDTIEEIIIHPKTMVVDGITHPKSIFNLWTDAEMKTINIVPVITSGTPLDSAYYIEKNEEFTISGDKNSVVKTVGVKVSDRKLDDEDAKDDKGNQLLNEDGSKTINYGLKTVAKNKATYYANSLCKGFNWLIQRKVTADTAIPSDVVTYMAAIRTDHKAICDAIDSASDMDAFITLHNDTYKEVDGKKEVDVVARVNRWTDDKDVKQYRR